MDIQSNGKYPSNVLSNFFPHHFFVDDIECYSMEGFLQSLKFKSSEMQKEVCKLVGLSAKKKGSNKNWRKKQILYWQGKEIKRNSEEYQLLLDKAFTSLFDNENFRKTLLRTKGYTLTHSLGKTKMSETVLTRQEFCSRLTKLRDEGKL